MSPQPSGPPAHRSGDSEPGRAALSVVLAMPDGFESIRRVIDQLRRQTALPQIELVIVSDSEDDELETSDLITDFAGLRIVRVEALGSRASANAQGCRFATAPVVAFAEDHCLPEPAWAEVLIRRHREAWSAVGPRVRNANPATAVSWCDFLINYADNADHADWADRAAPQTGPGAARGTEARHLPGHNTSYKRGELLELEPELEAWLEVETELHERMRAGGRKLLFEPDAVVRHVNISRLGPWLAALLYAGQIHAARRASEWSLSRRLLYFLAWPLIPFVRLRHILGAWPDPASGVPDRARLAPLLLIGLFSDAAGQALGFLAGSGDAVERMSVYELRRVEHLHPGEREAILGWSAASDSGALR